MNRLKKWLGFEEEKPVDLEEMFELLWGTGDEQPRHEVTYIGELPGELKDPSILV